jgi:XTP/dITP diphosphohydrolase
VIHTIVMATKNRGKLAEFRGLFEGLPVKLVAMDDVIRPPLEVVEDGATFAENAAKKAQAVAAATMSFALADDSGLEVDALGGRPGVRSSRFAHERASDAENNAALVSALKEVSDPGGLGVGSPLTARFRCVLALIDPYRPEGDAEVVYAEGVCEGAITTSARGSFGFGYDPLFIVAGRDKTMAELTEEEKNALSHRASACYALRPVLERLLAKREETIRKVQEAMSRR